MKDVICGMEVGENSEFKSEYEDKNYSFCSLACKQKFDEKPEEYAKR